MEKKGLVLWFTGLPGSGKTTIVKNIETILKKQEKVEVLDGDELRKWLSSDVGFDKEGRERHIKRVIKISEMLSRNGVTVLVALISPYRNIREEARHLLGESFKEIFVKCSLQTCIRRDPKGNYARALRGEIKEMTGIDDSYEEPLNPDLVINTEILSLQESIDLVLNFIKNNRK